MSDGPAALIGKLSAVFHHFPGVWVASAMAASASTAFKVPKGPSSNKRPSNAPQTGSNIPSTSSGRRHDAATSSRIAENAAGQGERNLESFESTMISTVRNGR